MGHKSMRKMDRNDVKKTYSEENEENAIVRLISREVRKVKTGGDSCQIP